MTLSFLVTAILLYIPANVFPIMTTEVLGESTHSTIIGGVVLFLKHGSYFIAVIIFVASVVVPIAKMAAIFWLCCATMSNRQLRHLELTRLYRLTEFVGKWSMVDVFVVAILVALIQVDNLMSIKPGVAALAFSGVVVFTMLSAQNFDVRLIWDKIKNE
ncbi:MAG: paraquat-inducible protein A [Paraglaciecola sp.]